MRRLLCCAVMLCAGTVPGCQSNPAPATAQDLKLAPPAPATARELKLTLVANPPPEGGLPDRLKLVFENISADPVRFIAPRPLYPEDAIMHPQPPPVLQIKFAECEEIYWPIFTDIAAESTPKPVFVILRPARQWSCEYSLKDFCFWGPCGPASGTDVKKYYAPGKDPLHMSAVFLLGLSSKNVVESPAVVVRSSLKGAARKTDELRKEEP